MSLLSGRVIAIATKHGKQQVIAPLLEEQLGSVCVVPGNLDTDLLGTFSGEVTRIDKPLEAARKKCRMAMQLANTDIAVASEGSFGPHPLLPFVPANEEFLLLVDARNNYEVWCRELSTETNYRSEFVSTEEDLIAFAEGSGFPEHALILRPSPDTFHLMKKGIQDTQTLAEHFHLLKQEYTQIWVETDMRAHLNPTRMRIIQQTAEKLVQRIQSLCPDCKTPGYGPVSSLPGLPCSGCGLPTRTSKALLWQCQSCQHKEERPPEHNKDSEDPMYCDFCNP